MKNASSIDALIARPPFALPPEQKRDLFGICMEQAFVHHRKNCHPFRRLCASFDTRSDKHLHELAHLPYVPVGIFKSQNLVSVPEDTIRFWMSSSATTGVPSRIPIDGITSKRQTEASARVMAEYLGPQRRPLLVLDEEPVAGFTAQIEARSAATRGILVFASQAEYFLQTEGGQPHLDLSRLTQRLRDFEKSGDEVCLFGTTYLLYLHVIHELKAQGVTLRLGSRARVVHIGGWKKLEDRRVGLNQFVEDIVHVLGIPEERIFDIYGFTEQMGLNYISQGRGPKTVPLYAEIIIRDPQTLEPANDGDEGLIQILTPIPNSYPGISVLTEDVGRIVNRGRDGEGRQATQFEVTGRAHRAEPRGCGDILGRLMET